MRQWGWVKEWEEEGKGRERRKEAERSRMTPLVAATRACSPPSPLRRFGCRCSRRRCCCWDKKEVPREESYREDVETSHAGGADKATRSQIYRDLRAACESGWDFSSRWFRDGVNRNTVCTSSLIPIDLNMILLHVEETLARYLANSQPSLAASLLEAARARALAIRSLLWDDEMGFFFDYDWQLRKQTKTWSLASAYTMYFQGSTPGCRVVTQEQAQQIHHHLAGKFLQAGGFVTTWTPELQQQLHRHQQAQRQLQQQQHAGGGGGEVSSLPPPAQLHPKDTEQWDWPNGWAPLQWITIKGLCNFGFVELACTAADRWKRVNRRVFNKTQRLMEKYDVIDVKSLGSGGEYKIQDGFGWTNAVYLMLSHLLPEKDCATFGPVCVITTNTMSTSLGAAGAPPVDCGLACPPKKRKVVKRTVSVPKRPLPPPPPAQQQQPHRKPDL